MINNLKEVDILETPLENMGYCPYLTRAAAPSYIRIFHASPNAPCVDVYANNGIIAKKLCYRNFTEYTPVPPGIYNIKVYPTGTKTTPVISTQLNIPVKSISTIAAIGMLDKISLMPISDPVQFIPPGKVGLRFVNLSPNSPSLDLTFGDNEMLFKNVNYKKITKYAYINPGKYIFRIKPTNSNKTVLYVPNIVLKPNRFYTIYNVGLLDGKPPMQVLIPLDGNSYIKI